MKALATHICIASISLLVAIGLLSGCGTLFKTTATVAITAERASDAWLDYVVVAKRQPGADVASLNTQDARVADMWAKYQRAMDAVYFARKSYVAGTDTPEKLKATVDAAARASGEFVQLVIALLPTEKAKALK